MAVLYVIVCYIELGIWLGLFQHGLLEVGQGDDIFIQIVL